MKVPSCKLCGKAHWTYEDHYTGNSAGRVEEYIQEMVAGALGRGSSAAEERGRGGSVVEPPIPQTATSAVEPPRSTKTCNTCNKPLHNRGKVCNACRQRAYRERSK